MHDLSFPSGDNFSIFLQEKLSLGRQPFLPSRSVAEC